MVLVRTPCYYKSQMTTDLFVRHFTSVADASPVPVLPSQALSWVERAAPPTIPDGAVSIDKVFEQHPEGPWGLRPRRTALWRVATNVRRRLLRPVFTMTDAGGWLRKVRKMRAAAPHRIDDVPDAIRTARLVVAAIEVASPVVTRSHLETCERDVLFVDLGLPRAVASDVHDLAHVRRIDIGDLRERVDQALGERHEAVDAAREIVTADVEKFLNDQRARGASNIVSALREHFDEVVASELSRREHDLEDLTSEQLDRVASVVRSVVAKIAHRPTIALKEAAGTDQGTRLSEATRQLFDL